MEILVYCNNSPPCHVMLKRSTTLCALDNCFDGKTRTPLSTCNNNPYHRWGRVSDHQQGLYHSGPSRRHSFSSQNSHVSPTRASSQSYSSSSHVIAGEEGIRSRAQESISKVKIPGLPQNSNGDDNSVEVKSCFWEWKPKLTVHYEEAGGENINSPPILFLPGFGVGTFHYEKQLKDLGRDYRVWALDFLGLGMSLPNEDPAPVSKEEGGTAKQRTHGGWGFGDNAEPWAQELVYSVDLWKDQVRYFIEEVIGEPVYIAGNSLGGYVALYFAATHPELVKGVTLLNATPFWGFLPNPARSPLLARLFPWAGTFPLPANVRKLTEIVWEKISDPRSIADILKQVYADHSTNVDKVFARILETTEHPAAPAAFTSIMCAPTGELSFSESLAKCRENNISICLVYGKEDPWVTPIWGQQVKKQLPDAPYYEISPAGHCPHDEVPEVVNYLLRGWIKNVETHGSSILPLLDDDDDVSDRNSQGTSGQDVTKDVEFEREGSTKKLVRVRFFSSPFSLWKQVSSNIRARLQKLAVRIQPR